MNARSFFTLWTSKLREILSFTVIFRLQITNIPQMSKNGFRRTMAAEISLIANRERFGSKYRNSYAICQREGNCQNEMKNNTT